MQMYFCFVFILWWESLCYLLYFSNNEILFNAIHNSRGPWGNCYDWQMREGLAETTCCLGSHFTGILVGLLGSHFTDTLSGLLGSHFTGILVGLLGSHFTDILVGLVGDTDTGTALLATGRITVSPLGTWSWSSLWRKYLVAQIPW